MGRFSDHLMDAFYYSNPYSNMLERQQMLAQRQEENARFESIPAQQIQSWGITAQNGYMNGAINLANWGDFYGKEGEQKTILQRLREETRDFINNKDEYLTKNGMTLKA